MNSGISTDTTELGTDAAHGGLQPWQFFVLAALVSATAALFLTRAQGVTSVVLLSVLIGSAALVGVTGLRMMRPLVSSAEDRTPMIGQRTREALEREKTLTLRTIKELEFDRAMGKMSEGDFEEMSGRLRARASRLIRQLDAGSGYRARIERDLANRLAEQAAPVASSALSAQPRPETGEPPRSWTVVVRVCGACQTQNDNDARFCKSCGARL